MCTSQSDEEKAFVGASIVRPCLSPFSLSVSFGSWAGVRAPRKRRRYRSSMLRAPSFFSFLLLTLGTTSSSMLTSFSNLLTTTPTASTNRTRPSRCTCTCKVMLIVWVTRSRSAVHQPNGRHAQKMGA
ncbi:hypothetical protein COCSADRAFT_228699 [Bipolaris sorokiniana ND90Pr]|nr:uncharacterized protein COCSADRAFT_228699 [Bipolaris sorokiniana ND90Pr]EMD62159.1 hypothetical protein COCSADRAFT_228699 [Bipolaris sorokiniana ND90Pr]